MDKTEVKIGMIVAYLHGKEDIVIAQQAKGDAVPAIVKGNTDGMLDLAVMGTVITMRIGVPFADDGIQTDGSLWNFLENVDTPKSKKGVQKVMETPKKKIVDVPKVDTPPLVTDTPPLVTDTPSLVTDTPPTSAPASVVDTTTVSTSTKQSSN